MSAWQYAVVSAVFTEESWQITTLYAGQEPERKSMTGGRWIIDVLDDMGRAGWELTDRSATGTGGFPNVNAWSLIFKKSMVSYQR